MTHLDESSAVVPHCERRSHHFTAAPRVLRAPPLRAAGRCRLPRPIDGSSSISIPNTSASLSAAMRFPPPVRVRDTVFFAYQHGGASLLDFLNAQSDYRTVELSYVTLIGAYLTSAAQLNMAVGREVIQ